MEIILNSSRIKTIHYKNFKITYLGFPFILGKDSIQKSIEYICDKINSNGINEASKDILGIYSLIIIDKEKNIQYVFVDNIGIMKLFYSENYISDSFLLIAKKEKVTVKDINKRGLVEFIRLGTVFNNKTYIENN